MDTLKMFYEVRETGNERMPYNLTGKRGAVYGLFRQVDQKTGAPRIGQPMFAVTSRGKVARLLRATEWVEDPDVTATRGRETMKAIGFGQEGPNVHGHGCSQCPLRSDSCSGWENPVNYTHVHDMGERYGEPHCHAGGELRDLS